VVSANGEDMGGYQAISFTPSAPPAPDHATLPGADTGADAEEPIAGVYRGASDHRKDGQAVGW
jgi:gamma-glutamyltranspeptidase/glutathione hydrolase